MKEFDYIIIGGGCAGLSLAYELEINDKLKEKTLAIIETREEYKRDKTWSFWKVFNHNFDDCVIKSWNNFTINSPDSSHELTNKKFPYQSIDSGKFYKKINSKLSTNSNISFFKNLSEINSENSIIFNSVHEEELDKSKLWQHFQGIEIETPKNIFDEEIEFIISGFKYRRLILNNGILFFFLASFILIRTGVGLSFGTSAIAHSN